MRPLRLEIEGFGTFRDRTEIDFEGLDLVALVGPTGSGKSTIIDAVTFALYGSVARYENTSLVAPAIHQLSTEAKVRFDFELSARRYTAVRVVRRATSKPGAAPRATTREARLERHEDGDGTTVLAGNVKELDAEIQRLIGLNFVQFNRTIVLPQGEFAEFLKDDPGSRQKLLRRLLDLDIYAQMGARAREVAKEAVQRVEIHRTELERLADVTAPRLEDARKAAESLAAFASGLGDRLSELGAIEVELGAKREAVTGLDRWLDSLAAIVIPPDLVLSDSSTNAALERLQQARAAVEEAQRARQQALDELDEQPEPAVLSTVIARRRLLVEMDEAMAGLSAEAGEAERLRLEAVGVETVAREAAELALANLRTARSSADAAAWVSQLEPGRPCPICLQEVTDLPESHSAEELAVIEADASHRQTVLNDATAAAARAAGRNQAIEAEVAAKDKQREELRLELVDEPELPALTKALARAEAAVVAADASARTLRTAESEAREAQAELERARKAESGYRTTFMNQRDTVGALGPPTPSGESLADDWQELSEWASELAPTKQQERAEIADAGKELAATKATRLADLTAEAQALGLPAEPSELAAALAAARATKDGEIRRLDEQLVRKGELDELVSAEHEKHAVFDALGRQHLSANGFERWLLSEALDDLVRRATIRLLELSNGRYSLEAVDGSFTVRDHANADERRDIRTLSGGEIFLASLSLALALAESIAELATVDGPRLESIFLDEGFGTLDADTLDTLAVAIEELSASGRLVAVVTHVRDLADRMPVRFEVRKGSVTSTIERVEG